MRKPHLRIIGDVHGKIKHYVNRAMESEYSIQIGDLGFNYEGLSILDPSKHRVLAGNHDNYESRDGVFINQTSHFLGDFGELEIPNLPSIFFVRGGRSIDWLERLNNEAVWGKTFWKEEELSYAKGMEALSSYEKVKPSIMLSHECPESLIDEISCMKTWNGEEIRPSSTSNLLQSMFEAHKPTIWLFGHHHRHFKATFNTTTFICLPELDYFDFFTEAQ